MSLAAALLLVGFGVVPVRAQRDAIPPDYPRSLERELAGLLNQLTTGGDVGLLTRLSAVYLDLGDDLYLDNDRRRHAYEEGAAMAKRALELQEANANSHFLYAANLGNAKRLQGSGAAALALGDIKAHVARAIALDPSHAQALQFMGGL